MRWYPYPQISIMIIEDDNQSIAFVVWEKITESMSALCGGRTKKKWGRCSRSYAKENEKEVWVGDHEYPMENERYIKQETDNDTIMISNKKKQEARS